jgi:hypothetical protein
MLGVADLAHALAIGATPRASGDLALHVLEILEAILVSGATGESVTFPPGPNQPLALSEPEAAVLT